MTGNTWHIIGGRPLRGRVRPSGSKNGALPTLAATLLLDGDTILHNVPRILDVETMLALLRAVGLTVEERGRSSVRITNHGLTTHRVPAELAEKMRASHYLLGPLLLRLGAAEMAMPGGCSLGSRPVTHITSVLETLGARETTSDHTIALTASALRGGTVTLDPVHRNPGATFTAVMAASLAYGETVIENASFEPDVVAFCELLVAAGATIEGIGTSTLTVHGAAELGGTTHTINPDRLEAGTFFCAAGATRGEVMVEGMRRCDLGAVADKLTEAGLRLEESAEGMVAAALGRPRGVAVVTRPFPEFPTDLQPPMAAMLATADGNSRIHESIFDQRLQYADQLLKMGARIRLLDGRRAEIVGVPQLHGAEVEAYNIRDGAALVVAALGAEGESWVSGRRFVARGYEDLEGKLSALGADIRCVDRV